MNKPITELQKIFGLGSAAEVGRKLNVPLDTLRAINSGRASDTLTTAFNAIVEAYKLLSKEKREEAIEALNKPLLTRPEREHRMRELEGRLSSNPAGIEKTLDKAYTGLMQYFQDLREYQGLRNL